MYSAAGLLGFLAYSCVADEWRGWIATAMVSNGLAYHGAAHWNAGFTNVLFCWDVACCAALGLYLNAASRAPSRTALASAGIVGAWLAGRALDPSPLGHIAHVLGVQLGTLALLITAR